jgi:hypothetical protein
LEAIIIDGSEPLLHLPALPPGPRSGGETLVIVRALVHGRMRDCISSVAFPQCAPIHCLCTQLNTLISLLSSTYQALLLPYCRRCVPGRLRSSCCSAPPGPPHPMTSCCATFVPWPGATQRSHHLQLPLQHQVCCLYVCSSVPRQYSMVRGHPTAEHAAALY